MVGQYTILFSAQSPYPAPGPGHLSFHGPWLNLPWVVRVWDEALNAPLLCYELQGIKLEKFEN